MLFASGCSLFNSRLPLAERPILPEMPVKTKAACVDPGVAADAYYALLAMRLAFAECKRRQHDSVVFYYDVKGRIEG
jgi:hypothetical protein